MTPPPASSNGERGLFTQRGPFAARPIYVPPNDAQQPYAAQPQYAAPQGGPYVAAPDNAYAAAPAAINAPYTLDTGDKLRIVVFGQDGITNSYTVDADGNVNLPLVGSVPARGFSTQQLSQMIAERLKQGYVREPHVRVEVETYRPFFILGEVTNPGQYPYVANMTAETAIAIAGGFSPRANKSKVEAHAQRARPADPRRRAARLPACAPAIPSWSRSGGSESRVSAQAPALELLHERWPAYFICLPGIPSCGSRPDRPPPCGSWRARRNRSRAARPDRRRFPPAAASS